MNTSFLEIYELFASKVTDFTVINFTEEEMQSFCLDYLKSAVVKIKPLQNELVDYDEDMAEFNSELMQIEKEIIALQMVSEWVTPQLYNTTLLKQFIGTSEERFFSPANQIAALRTLRDDARHAAQKLRKDYVSSHNSYFEES